MRQRKPKDLENRIARYEDLLVREPEPGCWSKVFSKGETAEAEDAGFFLEIGSGKGDFITAKAINDPDNYYIGIEGQESVLLRALEKAGACQEEGSLKKGRDCNLRLLGKYVKSMMDLFEKDSLSGIYLNFSDPWPKARHYKRRLTWRERLKEYEWALKDGGFIEIKTDNDDLFDFTMEEIAACGWEAEELSRDLHASEFEARLIMTEYEKKFHRAGKKINYVRVVP